MALPWAQPLHSSGCPAGEACLHKENPQVGICAEERFWTMFMDHF